MQNHVKNAIFTLTACFRYVIIYLTYIVQGEFCVIRQNLCKTNSLLQRQIFNFKYTQHNVIKIGE